MKLNKAHLAAFLIVELIFILVEAKGLTHISPGDENVYYYMAKSITEGQLPYRNFFYAHPPLHIFILSFVIKIFGVNFAILKSINLLALLVSSFFLYKTSVELFKNRLNDKHAYLISILSLILFLFSFEVMFKATFSLGIAFAFMFVMASFYFIFTHKYFTGGLLGGLAGLTRFYAVVPILAVFIFIFAKKFQEGRTKDFFYMLLGFFVTFGVVITTIIIFFGNKFIDPAINYHLLKLKLPNQRFTVYKSVLEENWPLILTFFLSLFIKNKKRFQIFFFTVFVYMIFLLSLNVPTEFYFSLVFPFMAIVGAYSFTSLIMEIKLPKSIRYAVVFLIAAVFLWNTTADIMFMEKIGFLEFSPLKQLADKISSTNPSQKIFGDDAIIPLFALMSNRSIALNYIDSNEKRFTSGLSNFYIFQNQLDDVNLSYIIFLKDKGLHQIEQFRQYAQARCSLEKDYYDYVFGDILMYKCS